MTSPTTAAFDRGAARYDLLVSLNPGYHRELRRAAGHLIERIDAASSPSLLDLGCGSGASTRALLDAAPDTARILGIDASPGMLAQTRAKAWPDRVRFRSGVAGQLDPTTLGGGHDGILACYLFRNVPEPHRDRAVQEAFTLLRPGGVLVAQEYSVADSRIARLAPRRLPHHEPRLPRLLPAVLQPPLPAAPHRPGAEPPRPRPGLPAPAP